MIDNKRIAKNTLMLYIRMVLVLLTTLYTSRILLKAIGVEDYGIYNVVGGVVIMFSFLNTSMSVSVQRFLSYSLGANDLQQFQKIYSASIFIHILMALVVGVLAITIGHSILANLTIPIHRIEAAHCIFYFSICSFMVAVCQTPFIAAIMAYEHMNIYAYISIAEVLLKLLIIYLLQFPIWDDKLELYGFLIFIVTVIIAIIYVVCCVIRFPNCRHLKKCDKSLCINIMSFSSWNLFGAFSNVVVNQGINILLNIFFGPIINAARGISYQVNSALMSFVYNVQSAINPQIIKLYAIAQKFESLKLSFRACRFSFYLLLLLSFPFLFYSHLILQLWLGDNVPKYASTFCELIIINSLIETMAGPLSTIVQATGRIKYYQVIVSIALLLNIPISYLLLRSFLNPYLVFVVSIVISLLALFLRVIFISKLLDISIALFFNSVVYKVLKVIPIICVCDLIFFLFINRCLLLADAMSFISFTLSTLLLNIFLIYVFGLDVAERLYVKNKLRTLLKH